MATHGYYQRSQQSSADGRTREIRRVDARRSIAYARALLVTIIRAPPPRAEVGRVVVIIVVDDGDNDGDNETAGVMTH